jgi:hypothetical protein
MSTEKVFARITKTRITGRFREGQGRRRCTVTAELHSLSGQAPYFSITMDTYRQAGNGRWMEGAFGCQHDEVRRLFPSLAPFLRWHCASTAGPMHYAANAAYWAGLDSEWCKGEPNDPPNRENFDATSLWGALASDTTPPSWPVVGWRGHPMDAPAASRAELDAILVARLPALLALFRADMDRLFADSPEALAGVSEAFAFQPEVSR